MSTLRSQDSVSSACYNRNKNLSVLRQGRRDLKLSLQRVIPEPTGFIESPRLSPRSYLERYETFYSQLNDMNVTKDTVDSILFTVFKNTSRRQFPPMTELIMSKTLLKLLSMAPTFDISQNKMILLILQNVTGFDTIYTNELLSMDVLTFLLHSIKEPKLVDSVSFVLVNICVDSPETARKLLKLGLNTFLLNYLTASQVMSYPIIWLLRCLLHNSENVEPFFFVNSIIPIIIKK
ncbi:IBB domain-containing protein [Entamoeba marina]